MHLIKCKSKKLMSAVQTNFPTDKLIDDDDDEGTDRCTLDDVDLWTYININLLHKPFSCPFQREDVHVPCPFTLLLNSPAAWRQVGGKSNPTESISIK